MVVRSNKLHLLRKDDVAKVDSVPLKIRSDDDNIIFSNNASYSLEPSSDTDSHDEAQTESRNISSASTTSVPGIKLDQQCVTIAFHFYFLLYRTIHQHP